MDETNLNRSAWHPMPMSHGAEPSAPPFPHAPSYQSFEHPPYHASRNRRNDVDPVQLPNVCPPTMSNQFQRPNLYHGNFAGTENQPPPTCPYWQHAAGQHRMAPSFYSGFHAERSGTNGPGGMDGMQFSTPQPMMHSYSNQLPHYLPGYDGSSPPRLPANSFENGQHYAAMSAHPPTRGFGEPYASPAVTPNRGSPSRPRQSYQHSRRQSQQESQRYGNRAFDHPGRRMAGSFQTQDYRREGDQAPMSNRRDYDNYAQDHFQMRSSSDVEEAAARTPPSSRVRRISNHARPHSYVRAIIDPNVRTHQQLEDLKAKLSRQIAGDIPSDASAACDICAKDYSSTHVKPCEEEEVAIELACGHRFGEFCIFQWFDTCVKHKNKVTCPMCRKQLIEPSRFPRAFLDTYDRGAAWQYIVGRVDFGNDMQREA
ncbi:hypothetical protein EK21DRAFT_84036 [Setomelanomma holmii]|uniref:RING-type domain-containing protein n=1 Tax=Setomelanomma holmii TaxID=210430 RepID=A0A9P4HJC6_9PLEO|nr:hypothetical protein EK21DRAFT_84036 [Setomelanomma holmii]